MIPTLTIFLFCFNLVEVTWSFFIFGGVLFEYRMMSIFMAFSNQKIGLANNGEACQVVFPILGHPKKLTATDSSYDLQRP